MQEDQVAWVNQQQGCGENRSISSGSDDHMVMSIRKKNAIELKISSGRVKVQVSGKKMWLWVDSGSPVTIFSVTDLKTTLSKTNLQQQPTREDFFDYNNNRTHILRKIAVTMALNGWVTPAHVSVIAGSHKSILGRDLMGTLGLELVQREQSEDRGARRIANVPLKVVSKLIYPNRENTNR